MESMDGLRRYHQRMHDIEKVMARDEMTMSSIRAAEQEDLRQQVQKLKERFKKKNLENIKVGSTEMFQGQERKVIIISTVRSSEDWVGSDVRHNLGFLDNPKRFNVAITRAQALLIIVGNPLVLRLDPHWGALLRQCVERGAYRGVPLPPMPGSESDVVAASLAADLEQLTLDDEEAAEQLEMPTYE